MRRLLLIILCLIPLWLAARMTDLNTATLNELRQLPITEKQAKDIYNYREYIAFFNNIFDLRKIPSIDQETLLKLRPLVIVSLYRETDDVTARREEIMSMLDRYDSNEGASEGMADVWVDYLMTPQNVNRMHFDDLISLPNVSPVDAVGVLYRLARGDTIADTRDLRNTAGLSYYGYSNLRNFVYYKEPPVKNRLFIDGQIQYYNRYWDEDAEDWLKEPIIRNTYNQYQPPLPAPKNRDYSYWGYFDLDKLNPDVLTKLRMRYSNQYKAGWMFYAPKAETALDKRTSQEIIDDSKFYAGYENDQMPGLKNSKFKLYFGNYRATFGEGLVMENTDYYSARKTGFGFSKRIMGITPDLSRTQEFALRGAAAEYKHKWFGASVFFSQDKKDAFVYMERDTITVNGNLQYLNTLRPVRDANGNYQVFSYITSSLRFDNERLAEAEAFFNQELPLGSLYAMPYINLAPRRNFLKEKLMGTHLQVSPVIGTKLGFTTYTALYDDTHFVVPDREGLKTLIIRDSYDYDRFRMINVEMASLYNTKTSKYERDFRRVIGFDGTTVIANTSLQGEYAELTVDGKDEVLGDDPKAYIISAYTQFSNLYFLTLFRNYDLYFDNPYSNAFSENKRMSDTHLDGYMYTLTNPAMADLYINSSHAQPEKGVYFETRYRFNNYFTIGRSYLDIWERLSDHRRSVRFQSELEFRPLFQVALRLRYKNQVNRYDDFADRGVSKTNEYTVSTRTFLSNRDFLEFEYRYNTVLSPPYVSLTQPSTPVSNMHASARTLMVGDYLGVNYTHHFNQNLYMQGSFIFWYGHGISHWDWEDMEIDFMGEKGCKSWLAMHSRISTNMYLSLKFKNKVYADKELFPRQSYYNSSGVYVTEESYIQSVQRAENTIRLQLDYRF